MFVNYLIYFLLFSVSVFSVDRTKFRKCSDTSFCRKYRNNKNEKQFEVISSSIARTKSLITALISNSIDDSNSFLNLLIQPTKSGSIRVKITEGNNNRWEPNDILLPDGIEPVEFSYETTFLPQSLRDDSSGKEFITFGPESKSTLVLYYSPFKVELYQEGVLTISSNSLNFMHFEKKHEIIQQQRALSEVKSNDDPHHGKEIVDYGEDGLAIYADGTRQEKEIITTEVVVDETRRLSGDWEETFGGHKDTKPEGPMSVGMDFTFHYSSQVYGIPEHASSLALKTTIGDLSEPHPSSHGAYKEPYRLYNLDVFEYELDEPMALYGHIPVMFGHGLTQPLNSEKQGRTAGIFWFNPSESFIDISDTKTGQGKHTHWMSETGNIDFFIMPGPSTKDVWRQYAKLTGTQQLPPMFSLGYHQCRWNYRDEKDVAAVEAMFEELDYPYDVLWLDIEHTDGKRYFTWDSRVFPTPLEMQKSISAHGRKMVTIVDPHIKRDDRWSIHKEATELGLYIKNKDGNDFDGWCWPGQSSYLDFTNPRVRQWWAERFALDKYVGSTLDLFTWNDMNEPSVFNGPEVSMQKDCKNLEGIEHRYWHNMYGLYMQRATAEGLTLRDQPTQSLRPFVLSRAFWAGSQRYGAIWTGDNTADWGHLKIASPMLLSIGLAGLAFCGADVGGFFGEPSAELFTRWYQAGSFTPFFRGHAHHDTKRREPWLFGDDHTAIHRSVSMLRYSLLPYWYTVFYETYRTGTPVMRPMFSEFPNNEVTFNLDDQWMVGSSLLVKPVTDAGVKNIPVYFPTSSLSNPHGWYDFYSLEKVETPINGGYVNVDAPLSIIPVFIKGGSIIPRKMRLRRSSKLMFYDPYTFIIAPTIKSSQDLSYAKGYLYIDDETTLAHERQAAYSFREFEYISSGNEATLKSSKGQIELNSSDNGEPFYDVTNVVERIIIAGQTSAPTRVSVTTSSNSGSSSSSLDSTSDLEFTYDKTSQLLTIKKPLVVVTRDWVITITF